MSFTGDLAAIKAGVSERTDEERAGHDPGYVEHLELPSCPVGRWIAIDPPPRQELFEGTLATGTVAALAGPGGGGKTFACIHLAVAAATGRSWGPFKPTRPTRVLLIAMEDCERELWRRFRALGQALSFNSTHLDAIAANLTVAPMVGKLSPILELDPAGNPRASTAYSRLRETIISMQPGLLVLDPKSRLFGLEENRADHATAWVQALESLVAEVPGLVVLFTHHSPKGLASQDRMSADAVFRGSSGLADAVRWGAGLRAMTAKDADVYGVTTPRAFVELDLLKVNHAPQWPGPVYFKRIEGGVLLPASVKADRDQVVAETLANALAEAGGELSRRDLKRAGGSIKDALRASVPGWKPSHLDRSIDAALRLGLIEEAKIYAGPKAAPKAVLRPVMEPEQ